MFCHAAMLKAALPSERGADIDTDGVGFLAWLMAVLSAARRGTPLGGVAGLLRGSAKLRKNVARVIILSPLLARPGVA